MTSRPNQKSPSVVLMLLALGLCGASSPSANAADKKSAPYTFVVFGDNRPADEGLPVPDVFKQIIGEVRNIHPAFVVTTGDLISGSAKDQDVVNREYDEVLPLVQSLGVPVYFAAGNHEIRGVPANEAIYRKRVSDRLYYSFDYGTAHFTVLDSDIVGQEHRITGKQFDWLERDLHAAQGKQHRFVFLHQQPYPVSYHIGSSLDVHPVDRDRFQKALEDNHVELLITGHEHLYDDSIHGGVREIIAGGAGAPLYPSIRGGSFFHYLIITVDGAHTYVSVVKPGSLFASDEILEKSPSEKVDPAAKLEH